MDFRPGLVEDQNIEPKTLGELDAGKHLLTPIKVRNFRGMRPARERFAVRQQVHIFAHRQRHRTDLAFGGRDPGTPLGRLDGDTSIGLGRRLERRDSQVEVRAGGQLDALPRAFMPMRDGDRDGNAEIATTLPSTTNAAADS